MSHNPCRANELGVLLPLDHTFIAVGSVDGGDCFTALRPEITVLYGMYGYKGHSGISQLIRPSM